jgi:hypothetical protein
MILGTALFFGILYLLYFAFDHFKYEAYNFKYIENSNIPLSSKNLLDLNKITKIKDKSLSCLLKTKKNINNKVGKFHIKCNLPYDN